MKAEEIPEQMFNDVQIMKLIAFQNGRGKLKFIYDVFDASDPEESYVREMTLQELLEEINDGHSDAWEPYDETDWLEGMFDWTNYRLAVIDSSVDELMK